MSQSQPYYQPQQMQPMQYQPQPHQPQPYYQPMQYQPQPYYQPQQSSFGIGSIIGLVILFIILYIVYSIIAAPSNIISSLLGVGTSAASSVVGGVTTGFGLW